MTQRKNLSLRNGIVRLVQFFAFELILFEMAKYGVTGVTIPILLIVILFAEHIDRQTRLLSILGNRRDDHLADAANRMVHHPREPPDLEAMHWPSQFEAKH